jgi:hypothetical protein
MRPSHPPSDRSSFRIVDEPRGHKFRDERRFRIRAPKHRFRTRPIGTPPVGRISRVAFLDEKPISYSGVLTPCRALENRRAGRSTNIGVYHGQILARAFIEQTL